MNLVLCGKECAYQKDGCCTRSGSAVPGEGKVDGCCYFEPAKKGEDQRIAGETYKNSQIFPNLFRHSIRFGSIIEIG